MFGRWPFSFQMLCITGIVKVLGRRSRDEASVSEICGAVISGTKHGCTLNILFLARVASFTWRGLHAQRVVDTR